MKHNNTEITCTVCRKKTVDYVEDKIAGSLEIYCFKCAKERGY